MPFVFTTITFFSTVIGGLLSLKFKKYLHYFLGLTAGLLLGVVAFDIFPEIFELVNKTHTDPFHPMIALVFGFMFFHIAEKFLTLHHAHEEKDFAKAAHPEIGMLSAVGLFACSFLDGVGIGFGFQVSTTIGILVALAVVAHDASDGINTVSLMLAHKNTERRTLLFLFLDALVPTLGAISTLFFKLPPSALLLYLGYFAGFLIYIGAADILPQAHSKHSSWKTVALTTSGVVFIYIVSRVLSSFQ